MGGDQAPAAIVSGAVRAARRAGLEVVLVGVADRLHPLLQQHAPAGDLPVRIVDTPDFVTMDEPPLAALRRKPRASVRLAADLVARDEAHALFSAGHTGATFLAAHAAFGVLAGVERPALAVTIPTRTGAAILVDAGANLECRPSHLVQFGLMGAAYARVDLRLVEPKVGLLSIGEEAGKGQ
jgi:glycerol-3-phosphate acyltransferase PlsX